MIRVRDSYYVNNNHCEFTWFTNRNTKFINVFWLDCEIASGCLLLITGVAAALAKYQTHQGVPFPDDKIHKFLVFPE